MKAPVRLWPHHLSEAEIIERLEARLGILHARRRLDVEVAHEARVFGGGFSFFHLENWYSVHALIRGGLKLTGLYGRAERNTLGIRIVENHVTLPALPRAFAGFRILQLSDLHIDMNEAVAHAIIERARTVDYDLCVLTGDYRFRTFGDVGACLDGMRRLRGSLTGTVLAVLGNHDSVAMLPELEDMGIRLLMNESTSCERGGERLYLAGIDDAHFFAVGDIDKALAGIPDQAPAILLSHTPEVYRDAARAGVRLMLSGHTHGGQLCLPGGLPITLDARIPRRLGRGAWRHGDLQGYTSPGTGSSVVGVRLNCPPEITVHVLQPAEGQ
ncbi:MAG: metallophosphoesterase [Pseudomonadales bacterium]